MRRFYACGMEDSVRVSQGEREVVVSDHEARREGVRPSASSPTAVGAAYVGRPPASSPTGSAASPSHAEVNGDETRVDGIAVAADVVVTVPPGDVRVRLGAGS